MKQYKIITLLLVFLSAFTINAQQKLEKISKSVTANKDVTLNLDTSYSNIEISTWDKNEVRVEAYIESSELTKEELQEALKDWDVKIEGSGNNITIKTNKGWNGSSWENYDFDFNLDGEALKALEELQVVLADIPEMIFEIPAIPEMPEFPEMDIQIPEMNFEMPEMPEFPELPELPEGVHNVNFDVEKYKKEGEPYLEKWSQEYEDKYGEEYKIKMKKWAREFAETDFDSYSKKMEIWGENFGEKFGNKFEEKMEAWGEKLEENFGPEFEEKMEAWGKQIEDKFGPEWEAKMEAWGEKFGDEWSEKMEKRAKELEEQLEENEDELEERERRRLNLRNRFNSSDKVIKTIKIQMPKDTKLKVDVRHGELKFTSVIHNLKADLTHSSLLAERIDGSSTSINASYTQVVVNNWDAGELKLKYVDDALLKHVKTLMLSSNSSNVNIDYLKGNSIINGSFGDLTIHNIMDSFNNLNIVLENSDANIKLPKADYNLQYQGNRTRFKHPNKTDKENISTFSTGNLSSNKTIVINAKFSNIVME